MSKGYDDQCKLLAIHFIGDHVQDDDYISQVDSLAQAIQDAVEDWLRSTPYESRDE